MIHLERPPKPDELTDEVVAEKTALFKADNNQAVWKEPYIHSLLLRMSYNKCCYCECDITEESKYMEIDHFHDKHDYPDEVVEWTNLLPSCKKCNGTKGTDDTVNYPIINPTENTPSDHLYLYNGVRFRSKDSIGSQTITTLDLNNQDRHCTPRYELSQSVTSKLEELYNRSNEYQNGERPVTPQGTGRLRNDTVELLQKGKRDKVYASIVSSAILNDPYYPLLKQNLQALDRWNTELDELEQELSSIRYDDHP